MAEEQIGRVTHYFGKAGVAAREITDGTLAVGDTIRIKGHTSDPLPTTTKTLLWRMHSL
jgi:hypothetical protein